jgi:two-component system alkaline phosphatase synthesis response regulator PhoP
MAEGSKRVLVVDDEADAREFVRTVAEDLGYAILEATDGEEGLTVARAEIPDLIVLDVQMPKRDGYSVFSELRKDAATRQIPVIMLTGITERTGVEIDGDQMGEYLGSEPEAYIDKPIEPATLSATLTRLLGG